MNNLPIYRAEKIDSDEYVEGYYASAYDIHHYIIDHLGVDTKTNTVYSMSTDLYKIDPTTLAIQMGKRKLFMSLDIETGKGGDKISDNEVLVWNDGMMNCSVLKIMDNGAIEYEISLDNCDFDKMEVIGIQQ